MTADPGIAHPAFSGPHRLPGLIDHDDLPETLWIELWEDPAVDGTGHDPRSSYVEAFWLGILGPSTTWLLRHLAAGLERSPGGFLLEMDDLARRLGIGHRSGRHSPLRRSLGRAEQFGMARSTLPGRLAVRRRLPSLSARQVEHLPPSLARAHHRLMASGGEAVGQRARRLALSLVQLGEDRSGVERQLRAWKFDTEMAAAAAAWACDSRSEATPPPGQATAGPVRAAAGPARATAGPARA
ncbi:MAG: hypothetical protein ACRDYD_03445, partial [Acidimicrobiales bacterium]